MAGNATKRSVSATFSLLVAVASASSETVVVKYRGSVPLDTFQCHEIDRSGFVNRVCYDATQQYMIVMLGQTYYQYCEIDPATVAGLLGAPSMGKFF
jgi:KTSC domain